MDQKQKDFNDQTILFDTPDDEFPPLPQEPVETSPPPSPKKVEKGQSPKAKKAPAPQLESYPKQEANPTVVPQPQRKQKGPWSVVWRISTYVWKLGLGVALVLAIAFMGMVGLLTVTEYNPAYAETADRGSVNRSDAITDRSLSILTLNTGYAGLGSDADFFLAGGEGVLPADIETVEENMGGIQQLLLDREADFIFLQEVDVDSQRSFELNQWLTYEHDLEDYESRFALDQSCQYVPYPITQPIGKLQSGLATYSAYDITSATRYSLPTHYSWPARTVTAKRCLLVTRIPIDGSEQELVLVNVHMDSYEDETVEQEQIQQLLKLVKEEYAKGNYVIAGGDFSHYFPKSDAYPVEQEDVWTPDALDSIFAGWQYAYDDSVPTCRLLNQPYDPYSKATQYYVIDGFLVSPNVTVDSVSTLNYRFSYSDHNPVLLEFTLSMDATE